MFCGEKHEGRVWEEDVWVLVIRCGGEWMDHVEAHLWSLDIEIVIRKLN